MKTEKELQDAIVKITTELKEEYPEIYKYVSETPVKEEMDAPVEVRLRDLEEYYTSLVAMKTRYDESEKNKKQF